MAQRFKITIILLIILNTFHCQKDLSPIVGSEQSQYYTFYETPDGILMRFDSLKQSYTLDEEIRGEFIIINNSESKSFHIVAGNGPLATYYIYDESEHLVNHWPPFRTMTYYDFYFNPGDTLGGKLRWNHFTRSNDHFSDLKAYSGKYLINPTHPGLPTNKVGKWITINEIGDPISTKFLYDFTDQDTLRLDFIIRNRISKNLVFELEDNDPVKVEYIDYSTKSTVLSHSPIVNFEIIELSSKSQNEIYSYRISRVDSIISEINGSYICKISIRCKKRTLSAESWIIL